MKKFNINLLLILGMFLIVNTIAHAYWIRYRVTVIVRGREVYSETITESEYNYKWKYVVPYSFREDIEEETCRIPAQVRIKRIIR